MQEVTVVVHPDGTYETGPTAPLAIPSRCCGGANGLPAPNALVLIEEQSADAWLFDAGQLTWTQLDDRPSSGFVLGSVVIDGRLIVVNAAPRTGDAISTVAELDLETRSWTELDALPIPISVGGVSALDGRLIVAGTRQGPNNDIIGNTDTTVLQFTPPSGWIELPPAPISGQAATVVPLPEGQLLAFNYDLEAALAARSGNWTTLADVPMRHSECYPHTSHVADGVAAFCGGVAWWDSPAATWTAIPTPESAQIVALDDSLIAFARTGRDQISLLRYPLPPGSAGP
jgi:hypothetical protein